MKIVQIGTCVGNDDLTEILNTEKHEILILVEPMSIHNDKIYECYKDMTNMHLENIAITTDEHVDNMSFFYHKNDGPKYEVSTTDINHILKHGYTIDGVVEINVKCMTLNKLFEKYALHEIDVLFLDAEGLDDSIIKSINFNNVTIKKIYFENLHIKDNNIFNFLISLGYTITKNVGYMGWSTLAEKTLN